MSGAPVPGDLDVRWHAGWPSPKHDLAPEIQVHQYEPATWLLRQNRSVHYEAPFMFLLLGSQRALLVDTGATTVPEHFPLRATVDALLERWLRDHPRPGYELVVAHTHGHDDHIAGDAQFAGRPATTVVGPSLAQVKDFYDFTDWPASPRELDLGDRVVDVVPGPGHEEAATVFYDRRTALLLTGDTLYPGRLYVWDQAAYSATVDRLLDLVEQRPVAHVLGCHIEMTTAPGRDHPRGATHQPDEPPLQMPASSVRDLRAALDEIGGRLGAHPFDAFIVHHLPQPACGPEVPRPRPPGPSEHQERS